NAENTLTLKQVEYVKTIHASGSDLLDLINEILDLSKIESGTMSVTISQVTCLELAEFCERTFHPIAESKHLEFHIELDQGLPVALQTDGKRVQQVLKNLLSNAFKFTEIGRVDLTMRLAKNRDENGRSPWGPAQQVAFEVRDTGP